MQPLSHVLHTRLRSHDLVQAGPAELTRDAQRRITRILRRYASVVVTVDITWTSGDANEIQSWTRTVSDA